MRIVFIRSNPVSPYPRLEKTANSLKKFGHQVQILAWDRNQKYSHKDSVLHLSDCDVKITRFGIPGKFGGGYKENSVALFKFQIKIFAWLFNNRKSYDVIHAYDFDTGYTALICSKLLNKKLVYDIPDYYIDSHGLKGTGLGKIIQKLENNVINKADATIICTERRKKQIEGTYPKKLVVIHNAPPPQKIVKNMTTNNLEKLKIVYVGILADGRFIREIADVVIKRKDCEFHIGGFGKLEDYFTRLATSHNNIYFYGKLPYDETLALEKRCDVITAIYDPKIPNHTFAAPNKFYEALMLGKPLIMVKNTGMDHVVTKNKIGEVIEYNVESLNNALDRLIKKQDKLHEMSERTRRIYDNEYSWIIMEKRLVDLYNSL